MSRTNKFLGGATLGALNMVVSAVLGLWLTRFYLRHLGQRDLGYWLIATQVISYLMLIDFGLVALLPRQTAYEVGRAGGWREARGLPTLIGHISRLVTWQLPLLAAAMIVIWIWLPADWQPVRQPLALVFVFFVALFPLRIPGAVLQGLQDLAFVGAIQFATWTLNALLSVVLLLAGFDLSAFAVAYVASQGLSGALSLFRLVRKYPGVLPRRLPPLDWPKLREQITRGGWVSLTQVAQILIAGTDMVIIGRLVTPAAVVPYAITSKLLSVLGNQPLLLVQSASSGLSELRTGAGPERLARVGATLGLAVMIASGFVTTVVIGSNKAFVGWWVGPDQYGGLALTVAFGASLLLRHWTTCVATTVFALGHERLLAIVALADGLTRTALSIVLLLGFGVIGLPLASVASMLLVSLPASLVVLAREARSTPWSFIREILPWSLRFGAVAALAAGLSVWMGTGFLAAALTASASGLLYLVAAGPLALREPLGSYVRPRLLSLLRRLGLERLAHRRAGAAVDPGTDGGAP